MVKHIRRWQMLLEECIVLFHDIRKSQQNITVDGKLGPEEFHFHSGVSLYKKTCMIKDALNSGRCS